MYTKKQIDNLNNDIKSHFKHLFPITEDMKLSFDGVSRMVMLDRYSQKDQELKTLGVGDVVLTIVKNDPSFPTRGIGSVVEIRGQKAVINIEEQYAALVSDEFKIDKNVNNIIIKEISTLSKPLELFFEQIATRIGNALGQDEADTGRVLYGAGSGKEVTFFNCYVMPYIKDSREGIANHREKVAEIMSRGGGVGTNGSTLRPKGDAALGVGGTSSGASEIIKSEVNNKMILKPFDPTTKALYTISCLTKECLMQTLLEILKRKLLMVVNEKLLTHHS
ncbi:hypothetical protein FQA39_LY12838 [Lamprigera yunnana]|nr:hypothetical protein FQA39_LY12838 [Lamprigera yunnana]